MEEQGYIYLRKQVSQRKASLIRLISVKTKALAKAPDGWLRITRNRGNDQYYQMLPGNGKKGVPIYLSKKDMRLASKLAQKSYDKEVLSAAEKELKAWNMLASFFPETTVEELYETLSPARQALVVPVEPTDEQYRAEWEAVEYTPKPFKEGAKVFYTDRGERVRSKSEQLIANLLYRLGIPYRYECPIKVTVNGKTQMWYPDFTILDVKNRKEVYLEHLGMLDDRSEENNYARNAFWKMKVYEENGICEGKNMLYSFETGQAPLDITYVEMKLRRMLGMPPLKQTINYPSQTTAPRQHYSNARSYDSDSRRSWVEPDYDTY